MFEGLLAKKMMMMVMMVMNIFSSVLLTS